MIRRTLWIPVLLAALGCASVAVGDRDEYRGEKLPRPGRIIVHDFAATPSDLPSWSEERVHFTDGSGDQTAEDLAKGRELGAKVAEALVEKIAEMGLPGVRAADQPAPREGDLVLIGAFTTLDEGSTLKRVVIGFGSGAPEVKTHVAGYRMTNGSLRKLGSGDTDSKAEKTPGAVVPAIVTIATANPIGLAVGGAVKAAGELSGHSTIDGAAERTAKKIADVLEEKFKEQGWI